MAVIIPMTAIVGWAVASQRLTYVITHGVSMQPVYYQDDLVFVLKADSYRVGDIAAYRGSVPGLKVLHRIIGGDGTTGFILQGDNNASIDTPTPTTDELIGRAVLHVPRGGVWLKPLLSPTGLGMMGFLIISSGAMLPANRREIPRGRRKKKVKAMARQGGSWATATTLVRAVARLPLLLRVVAATSAAVLLMAGALAVLGWMKPLTEKPPPAGPGQSVTFAYSAQVPKSPAYDGTTVTSPDPVFRRLAERVAVHVRYGGPPGALDVSAVLSNSAGWRTTLQLAAPRKFSTGSYDTKVDLDLVALNQRADQAARAIGIAPSPITISLKARVVSAGLPVFVAPLTLNLAPLQLTLPNGEGSLIVANSADNAGTLLPRYVNFAGHRLISASTARSWAIILFILAAGGAVAVLLVARRGTPMRNRADIERRHPQLLVHVEPMASPPGKPVVNVDNFPALVKLAERYGQMILTWRRPDADDFVVRDEGITYRYRIPLDESVLQNIELINRPPGTGSHRRKASAQVS